MPEYYIGLMSGTSMDGIDATLVDFSAATPKLVAANCLPWPESIRTDVFATRELDDAAVHTLQSLDVVIGEQFANSIQQLLQTSGIQAQDVIAVGSHGQTIRHRTRTQQPFSLQMGNAEVIAQRTGIDVVSDFRSADIQAGGEGAPLAPAFHRAVFHSATENRCVLNLGGIANITLLPADTSASITGFDTGPGNGLMDAWISQHQGSAYDAAGAWAAQGQVVTALLDQLLSDAYFKMPPPKSTGFEYFNIAWLSAHLPAGVAAMDVQATLCELSARSISEAIQRYAPGCKKILGCGGGVHNRHLMQRLQSLLPEVTLATTESYGVHPDWVEAMAFAWLARQNIQQQPANLPSVTGAREAVILGKLSKAA